MQALLCRRLPLAIPIPERVTGQEAKSITFSTVPLATSAFTPMSLIMPASRIPATPTDGSAQVLMSSVYLRIITVSTGIYSSDFGASQAGGNEGLTNPVSGPASPTHHKVVGAQGKEWNSADMRCAPDLHTLKVGSMTRMTQSWGNIHWIGLFVSLYP